MAGIEPLADSVDVAAARMGIGRVQLYKEAKEGRLELRKCGRRTLVTRTEQARWVNALPIASAA